MKGDNCSEKGCTNKAIGYWGTQHWGKDVCKEHAPKELFKLEKGQELWCPVKEEIERMKKPSYNYYARY